MVDRRQNDRRSLPSRVLRRNRRDKKQLQLRTVSFFANYSNPHFHYPTLTFRVRKRSFFYFNLFIKSAIDVSRMSLARNRTARRSCCVLSNQALMSKISLQRNCHHWPHKFWQLWSTTSSKVAAHPSVYQLARFPTPITASLRHHQHYRCDFAFHYFSAFQRAFIH